MRKFLSILFVIFVSFGLFIHDAEAKRFGGARSFGMQRSASSFTRQQPSAAPFQQAAQRTPNRWLGPLAGLAAGGMLGYLLGGHGMGSGIFSWLAIAAIGFFLWNMFRSRLQPATQPRFNQFTENPNNSTSQFNTINSYAQTSQPTPPAGFDAETFLRDAKAKFIRLQAAYDTKNVNDLREFTTPEVLAEIQLQFHERGNDANYTEVVSLNAEILDVATESQVTVASVQFSGTIREEQNMPATLFTETWHFRKENSQSLWLVAGVQQ